ncbi:MAG: ABC transporter permease subunit [bacterium]|nr:ABC transporter permease subunit [bacterium]
MNVQAYVEAIGGSKKIDRLTSGVLVVALLFMLIGVFLAFLPTVLIGIEALSFDTLFRELRTAGAEGGIGPVLVSTFYVIGLSCLFAVPFALVVAAYLTQFIERESKLLTLFERLLEFLAAVPSIVYGLVGNGLFCVTLGLGYSILAGALTLALMILPFLIKAFYESLYVVSKKYRVHAVSLSLSRSRFVCSLLLPSALPGLLIGFMLGLGRALAETAALLFTSGYSMRYPASVFDSGRVLSVHIYDLSMNVVGGERLASLSATVLLLLVLFFGITVNIIQSWWRVRNL